MEIETIYLICKSYKNRIYYLSDENQNKFTNSLNHAICFNDLLEVGKKYDTLKDKLKNIFVIRLSSQIIIGG